VFERFTERARQVVVLAQDEARGLRHNYIGTEHLLLGLLREEQGLAARALASLGLELEDVRGRIAAIVGEGEEVTSGQIPFTPRAKQALELSLKESRALDSDFIGTEHILLGLARIGEGVAARVLLDFDADADKVRGEILRTLGSTDPAARAHRFRFRPTRHVPVPGLRSPDWEYRVEQLDGVGELTQEWLNERGSEGWELTAMVPADDGPRLVFKRRRPPGPPPPPPPPSPPPAA
jgi:ATP-dependent Clp protease ATP-binding subunit ClpA